MTGRTIVDTPGTDAEREMCTHRGQVVATFGGITVTVTPVNVRAIRMIAILNMIVDDQVGVVVLIQVKYLHAA